MTLAAAGPDMSDIESLPAGVLGIGESVVAESSDPCESCSTALDRLGFSVRSLIFVSVGGLRMDPIRMSSIGVSGKWEVSAGEGIQLEADPRMALVMASGRPCLWTLSRLRQAEPAKTASATEYRRKLLSRLSKLGIRSGLVLPIRSSHGDCQAIASLGSRRQDLGWMTETIVARAWYWLNLLAETGFPCGAPLDAQAHPAACCTTAGDAPASVGRLSTIQQRILQALCEGLEDKLIASQLRVSVHNVDYHLRRLRERFGVRNRTQLVQASRQFFRELGIDA